MTSQEIVGLSALVGASVGSLLTFLGTFVNNNALAKREREQREEERKKRYEEQLQTSYQNAIYNLGYLINRIDQQVALHGLGSEDDETLGRWAEAQKWVAMVLYCWADKDNRLYKDFKKSLPYLYNPMLIQPNLIPVRDALTRMMLGDVTIILAPDFGHLGTPQERAQAQNKQKQD